LEYEHITTLTQRTCQKKQFITFLEFIYTVTYRIVCILRQIKML